MRTIPRNRREVNEIRAKALLCRVYTLSNQFSGAEIDPVHAWKALAEYDFARLQEKTPGRAWHITLHSNTWYELTAPEPELAALAARGYNIISWQRWQQGSCHAYALGLIAVNPKLRFGTIVRHEQRGDDEFEVDTHHFAHDDTHAYDSAGRHPLPYLGIDPEPGHRMRLDDDPTYYDESAPDEILVAMAHARAHGILDGRYGPDRRRPTAVDWREAGRQAFARGEPKAPAANPAVREAITGLPVGGGAYEIMKAFSDGWDEANLAAPVDEPAAPEPPR